MPLATAAESSDVSFRDRKRPLWLLSVLVPAFVGSGPLLVHLTGQPLWTWAPLLFVYLVVPLVDLWLGEDRSNPPESAVPALQADRYYRWITYATVPVVWGAFIGAIFYLATQPLPLAAQVAMVLCAGVIGGFGINLGHELGHKPTRLERWLAKIVLAPTGYGHFLIEHNLGHHRDVATPEDPASARMGETIYGFLWREMPGAFRRAWIIEAQRLRGRGLPLWSVHNEILQPAAITLGLWGALLAWLGWVALPFILLVAFWANFQLTSANYIEHYGLLRGKRPSGRYEPCRPHHSWNSNHVFSNWMVFHLQRHSDHHAHPLRRYQALRHFDGLPTLPNGYVGVFLMAYVPALWFRVMDPRLVKAVDAEASRINFHPPRRDTLIRQYGLRDVAVGD